MLVFVTLSFYLISCSVSQRLITKYDELYDNNYIKEEDEFNPDVYLTTAQIARRHGYSSESHVIETSDGFLLTVHRIWASKNGVVGRQPVFLQHGLLGSSDDWIITGEKSLVFILSDLGYDVWLGNCRGNSYSKAHSSLAPDSDQFWDYSFEEMAIYDLPAVFSHIENTTKTKGEIIYIGHSMGTTMFFAFASTTPNLAKDSVKAMVALAPVAYMGHVKSPIRYFAPFSNDITWLAKHLGIRQFLPNNEIMKILEAECTALHFYHAICREVIFALCGFDSTQLSDKLLPLILSHDPAGISTKTLVHYAQEIYQHGNFQEFDYGKDKNLLKYGTPNPPSYNVSNIRVPLHLMYSLNDLMAVEQDVYRLANQLSGDASVYKIPLDSFNHIDFIWGNDAPELVYKNLIEFIKHYPA